MDATVSLADQIATFDAAAKRWKDASARRARLNALVSYSQLAMPGRSRLVRLAARAHDAAKIREAAYDRALDGLAEMDRPLALRMGTEAHKITRDAVDRAYVRAIPVPAFMEESRWLTRTS